MKIVVTSHLDDVGLALLRDAGHDVVQTDADRQAVETALTDAQALVVGSDVDVTEDLLAAAPDLQFVGRAGIDTDNIDVDAATEHGVVVANAPESGVRATAEHAVGMTFATARKIPQGHILLRDGVWAKGDIIGHELNGKTLGVVGLGRIGQQIAKRLGSLEMDLVAYDPHASTDRADQLGAELVDDLQTCLDRADFLSVHAALGEDPLLGEDELAQLDGGYLINCASREAVDEAALAEAVGDGILEGAALDVFEEEPLPADSPLRDVENVILTPNVATNTESANTSAAISIAEQILAAVEGEPVLNALNTPSVPEDVYPKIRPYVELARTAGTIAVQLLDSRVEDVEITYAGDIAAEDVEYATASALAGVFAPLGWDGNMVNAHLVAEEYDVDVTESKTRTSEDFQSLLTVEVSDGEQSVSVCGTQFGDDDPRIVRIQDYRIEAIPHGHMLVVHNRDQPGVIGFVGTILGDHDLNIAGMFNSREAIGGEALTVYNLDQRPDDDVLAEIAADDRIYDLDYISLDNGDD